MVSERADQLPAAIKGAGERKLMGKVTMASACIAAVGAYLNKKRARLSAF